MRIHREGRVPAGKGRRLTKGNRRQATKGRPVTGGEETRHVQGDDQGTGATSQAAASEEERELLALLRELVDRVGPVRAAEALGVTYRTVTRAIETNTLTRRMEDALKLRQLEAGGAAGGPVMRRLEALERGQEGAGGGSADARSRGRSTAGEGIV